MPPWKLDTAISICILISFLFSALARADSTIRPVKRREFGSLEPITIKGTKFFYSNGTQFIVRGVHYGDFSSWNATSTIDPLGDEANCARDIPVLLKLGINTLFITDMTSASSHVGCMNRLYDAGIYIFVEWNNDVRYRIDGQLYSFWDSHYYEGYKSLVDSLHEYSNVIGFMTTMFDQTEELILETPWVKSVVREIKQYIQKKGYRQFPVGLGAYNHVKSKISFDYTRCGEDDIKPDFYILHRFAYEDPVNRSYTCRDSENLNKGLVDLYRDTSVPTMLGYFRCRETKPENFEEVDVIYKNPMSEVFAGAILNMWVRGPKEYDFGLVNVNEDNVSTLPMYSSLSSRLATITPTPTRLSEYTIPPATSSACHNFAIRKDVDTVADIRRDVSVNATIPPGSNPKLCSCMMESLNCRTRVGQSIEGSFKMRKKICAEDNGQLCQGGTKDPSTGRYGSYHVCNVTEKASFALQELYMFKNQSEEACKSAGGIMQVPTPLASMESACSIMLKQAGPQGTGTVTFIPTASAKPLSNNIPGSRGLSVGAKIGIGLSIGFVGLLFGVALLCLKMRKKKAPPSEESIEKPELADTSSPTREEPQLLDGTTPKELWDTSQPEAVEVAAHEIIELPTEYNERKELEGTPATPHPGNDTKV